ncbi:MAG: chitobiase/beta-hexosaminidase C-terminal domain-containing protein [Luteolibacter sp.]
MKTHFLAALFAMASCAVSAFAVDEPAIADPNAARDAAGLVTLSCATPATTLRYSIDGTEPTSDSMTYSQPFLQTEACTP